MRLTCKSCDNWREASPRTYLSRPCPPRPRGPAWLHANMSGDSGEEGSPPSLTLLRNRDLYQLREPAFGKYPKGACLPRPRTTLLFLSLSHTDEGCDSSTEVPFLLLPGESPANIGLYRRQHLLVLTNYRLFASVEGGFYSRPLGLVEVASYCQPADLILTCRDACTIR